MKHSGHLSSATLHFLQIPLGLPRINTVILQYSYTEVATLSPVIL